MNDFMGILKGLAPTVASALLGPLGGVAVAAIGKIIGVDDATTVEISKAFQEGKITPEQIAEIKKLELQYQNEEKERGFKYAELEFKDRDSARQMQMATKSVVPATLTTIIVALVLGFEGSIMFNGLPANVSEIVAGRILGTLDASLMMVLAYWFGTTRSSSEKTSIIAQSQPVRMG